MSVCVWLRIKCHSVVANNVPSCVRVVRVSFVVVLTAPRQGAPGVAELVREHCVVQHATLGQALRRVFALEPRVLVLLGGGGGGGGRGGDEDLGSGDSGLVAVIFPHEPPSRHCLLPLPAPPPPKGVRVPARTLQEAVTAVNRHCHTFRASDGTLTLKGQHRRSILRNLFRAEHAV